MVLNGGKYDGMLGVIVFLVVIQYCYDQGICFFFYIDIVGFGDEEGICFGFILLGSWVLIGWWQEIWCDLCDKDQVLLLDVLKNFGLFFENISQVKLDLFKLFGYFEVYIE